TSSCVNARIAHQIIACADVTIRWRIQQPSADELFQDYRDFSNVRASLVTRELATDINAAFVSYDPLAVDDNGNATAPALNTLAGNVQAQMSAQIGQQIEVLSVFIPVLHFDSQTQGRLNALQAQIAQTRIAAQAVKTAQSQAAANQALAASVSTDPNVLVSKCFDVLSEMVTKGQQVPAGFSCWPGGGTGVVIPAAK
ncbi:MAG TPA: SPFH domain-containing protein, partial [Chloroflexota bacterium]